MAAPKDKKKFLLWAHPETLDAVKYYYRRSHCKSQSEFIEKAIQFYLGHLTADDDNSYLPSAFLSNMKSIVYESDNRMSRLLFKVAVELAMMMNIVASMREIDKTDLARLRKSCVDEVKRTNGGFSFEDAVKWQGS